MTERIDSVLIVGGGDSGLLTALAVEKLNPEVDVSVVDDFGQEIPQVGKSTYLDIRQILHGTLGFDEQEFVSEVKPVWKASVYFRDWCDYPSFHYPFDTSMKFPGPNAPSAAANYYHYYDALYESPDHRTIGEEIAALGKSPWHFNAKTGKYDRYDKTAYHLNTERFNEFLRERCRERGVSLIDDEIVRVEATGGRIGRLRSKSQIYQADLYVDATGFNRALVSELDREFVDFDVPLDSAFNARAERALSDVMPATVIDSGEHGWFWQIDTYDNRDLGYVFASEYVSDEEALQEFVDHCEGAVSANDAVKYEFTSGYHDPAWAENCLAIGNAEGFVEPLQSTGLTANAQAAVKLSQLLSAHGRIDDEAIRESYNEWVAESWESIYDFVSVHYRYADGDNEFWEAMQSIDVSDRVELLVREFDRNGLDRNVDPTTKRDDVSSLAVFNHMSFYVIMRNMGATSEFYETNDFRVGDRVKQKTDDIYGAITSQVSDYLTTEEFYRSVIED